MKKYMIVLLALSLWACHKNDPGNEPDTPDLGYVEPEPPSQVETINLFKVRYLTNLSDSPLWSDTDYSAVQNQIQASPSIQLTYLERADAQWGTTAKNPTLTLSATLKYTSLFVPSDYTSSGAFGTGILIKNVVTEYVCMRGGSDFCIAGTTVTMPAEKYFPFLSGCCRVETETQFDSFAIAAAKAISQGMCVIGTVKSTLATSLSDHLKKSLIDYRWRVVSELPHADYSLFVLSPLQYVYRSAEVTSLPNGVKEVLLNIEVFPQ